MNIKKIIKYIIAPALLCAFYLMYRGSIFTMGNETLFISIVIACFLIEFFIEKSKNGEQVYLRPIAGLKAMEEAVGRATEMGKPVLYVPGISGLDQIDTLAGLTFLGHVSEMTASYETNLHVPVCTPIVMEAARETCKESYLKSGHPELFNDDMVQYISDDQFAYVAGVNGIMQREKPAACFYQGKFYAESLILAETGNSIGAIQIAGTGSPAQIPFFVTACDFTLIGEEFFAASSYLSKKPELIGSIKGQDYIKLFSMGLMAVCLCLSAFRSFEYSNMDYWKEAKNNYENSQIINQWDALDEESKNIFLSGSEKQKTKFNILKDAILKPNIYAIENKASYLVDPKVYIDKIEPINNIDELVLFIKDTMFRDLPNINNMSISEILDSANRYYDGWMNLYFLDSEKDKFSPHSIEFSLLNKNTKNTFLQSISISNFEDLSLSRRIQLTNIAIGESSDYKDLNAFIPAHKMSEVMLDGNQYNNVILVKSIDYLDDNSKELIFKKAYEIFGEAFSSSFDLKEVFRLRKIN